MDKKRYEITIPTEPSEITLGQYLLLRNISEEDEFGELKMISVLCDVEMDVVNKLSVDDFNSISETLAITINKQTKERARFKIGDVEYGFIPNLDDITIGEYIDLDNFIRDEKNLHKVMSILYRPITEDKFGKYRIKEYNSDEIDFDIMYDCPYDVVQNSLVFFYNLGNELLNHIPTYLTEQLDKNTVLRQTLEQSGVGIQVYIDSLTNSLIESKKSHEKMYTRLLHS